MLKLPEQKAQLTANGLYNKIYKAHFEETRRFSRTKSRWFSKTARLSQTLHFTQSLVYPVPEINFAIALKIRIRDHPGGDREGGGKEGRGKKSGAEEAHTASRIHSAVDVS